jgi:Histidine-specific methyltransferase, SAM-dependent/Predicted nucleotide-binding protein containing TIR-like domain
MSDSKVFIGAPSDDDGLAAALQGKLEGSASVQVWNQGSFEENRGTLESLMAAIEAHDFACFLALPNDTVESRGTRHPAVRDNIIFEYGLFLASLGPNRVFLLFPRGSEPALPSDLNGVTHLQFKPVNEDNRPAAVLGPPAQKIEESIKRHGQRRRTVARRYSPVLERGAVDRVAGVSDAVVYFSKRRYGYKDDIRQFVLKNEVIPSMYYYATEEGAEYWLNMSANPGYRFKSNSNRLIKQVSSTVAQTIRDHVADGSSLDVISLGSGDGQKDRVLLSELNAKIAEITYYPLDISDTLIVECIKNVHDGAFDYAGMKTKAIIGDFIDLQLLRSVYEDRPAPNMFSVLGNTFGNTDEAQIVEALQNSMYPGDFVLIEINCDIAEIGSTRSFTTDEETLRYSCIPLEMLGVDIDIGEVTVREEERSIFQCAKSSATVYGSIELDKKPISEVSLAYNHRYPIEEFSTEFAENLSVEILFTERYGNAAVVLARRPD